MMSAAPSIPAPAVESVFGVSFCGSALMTSKEVAQALGDKDRSTIYLMVEAGDLEAHREPGVKTHLRITRRSVIARLALGATRPLPEMPDVILHLASTLSPTQRAKFIALLERMGSK